MSDERDFDWAAETHLLHDGADPFTGASSPPIYQASTFDQDDPTVRIQWDYGRSGNPTRDALEAAVNRLEGGQGAFAFASGMAATCSALMLLEPGARILCGEDVYGGTYRALSTIFKRWGLVTDWVDLSDLDAVRKAIRPETKALFVETPSNPLLRIFDLRTLAALAKEHGLLSYIDNTFATPLRQRPLDLGFDISVHSATKFISGHSDVVMGLAVARTEEIALRLRQIQNGFGAVAGPQDCWLALRGLRTLAVRLDREEATAKAMAAWFRGRGDVKNVWYPGLPEHPGAALHASQASGPGAVLSFELADGAAALAFLKRVKIPLTAVSLGGVESILSYPARMSHAAMPPAERAKRGITDGLLRLSCGLEDPADLMKDFEEAFG